MIFERINYWFALQDFIFSLGAGYAVGFINQILSVFLYKGKIRLFIKDIIICFVFALTVFSYVVSFTNYPIIRIYHMIGGLMGFFCFSFRFSTILHKFFEKIFRIFQIKMLCLWKKISTTICDFVEKSAKKHKPRQDESKNDHLKSDEELLYNL